MNCCFVASANDFLLTASRDWLDIMIKNYNILCGDLPSPEQIAAWEDCRSKMEPFLTQCAGFDCELVFEYELPREGGRRPDLLLFTGNKIFVLEFKRKNTINQADVDQVEAYARDIQYYHSMSAQLEIIPILIPTLRLGKHKMFNNVLVCTPDKLFEIIGPKLAKKKQINPQSWIRAEYYPLPSLVNAAKIIYKKEDLPYIRKAQSAGIPEAVSFLKKIADEARNNNQRVLALVTGVPGSGKTLLGLDFVYQSERAIYLSGNGPLVEVLQYALKSKTFVAPLRNYIKEYGIRKKGIPIEHLIVFDEAQRAWDRSHVLEKHNVNSSEPELITSIAETLPHWAMLLGLIGEGQEIHNGEEVGIVQWKEAIQHSSNKWRVICPPKLSNIFQGICEVSTLDCLDLNVSLRSHLADDVAKWANTLLEGQINSAAKLGKLVQDQGFHIYITRDLNRAKKYCRNRYSECSEKRYGLIASSKANILRYFGVKKDNDSKQNLNIGAWYNEGIDNALSCCQFDTVVTEFSCQGLELDMPILCWGEDLIWRGESWVKYSRPAKCKDPHQLRINSYRVLMTRGRDGFVIYMPEDNRLDDTYEVLQMAGAKVL